MDIRKADAKGRVTGFEPGELYIFDHKAGTFSQVIVTTSNGEEVGDALRKAFGLE